MPIQGNSTLCPINELPAADAWIPAGLTYGMAPASNDALVAAMETCCAPHPVNLAGPCVMWCEQPSDLVGTGPKAQFAPGGMTGFSQCIHAHANTTGGLGIGFSEGTRRRVVTWWMLGVSLMVGFVMG